MLTAQRDLSFAIARHNDDVDKAGEWRSAADEESGDSAPVGGVLKRVAVDTVEVVHIGYGDVTTSDDKIAVAWEIQISG